MQQPGQAGASVSGEHQQINLIPADYIIHYVPDRASVHGDLMRKPLEQIAEDPDRVLQPCFYSAKRNGERIGVKELVRVWPFNMNCVYFGQLLAGNALREGKRNL